MPTCQQYLDLLSEHITDRKEKYSNKKNIVDLGSGSGILPIIVKQKSNFSGKVTCLDFSENSLMCQKENLKEFGCWEAQLNLKTVDIVQKWLPKEIS